MHIWVFSESNLFAEALALFVKDFGFEACLQRTARADVALWHLAAAPCPAPPPLPTLALFAGSDAEGVELLQKGYAGCVHPNDSRQQLRQALETVARGEIWAKRNILANTVRSLTALRLTKREEEVLALLKQRLSNRAIAQKLGISERTVKTHVSNLLAKFGVDSRVDLILRAPKPYPSSQATL